MREPPRGWPRIASAVFYDDAPAAIDWLSRAFGFEVRLRVEGEGGRIEYSELTFDGGLIMVAQTSGKSGPAERAFGASPAAVGRANTQSLCICVDDTDAMCERARAAGGEVVVEPTTKDYGDDYWADRSCQVADPEGHQWWFMQRVREQKSSGK
ncbi:MAG TPA: VOC family protein [Kofleriaceae bacterium]|nr:VOC family protein [Kofleriaceae bacterium]